MEIFIVLLNGIGISWLIYQWLSKEFTVLRILDPSCGAVKALDYQWKNKFGCFWSPRGLKYESFRTAVSRSCKYKFIWAHNENKCTLTVILGNV